MHGGASLCRSVVIIRDKMYCYRNSREALTDTETHTHRGYVSRQNLHTGPTELSRD